MDYYERKAEEARKVGDELRVTKARLAAMQANRFSRGARMDVPNEESRLYKKVRQLTRALDLAQYVGD